MSIPTLDGVTAETISSERITTRVLLSGPDQGVPVLFLHGNFSCATWWEETMLALPPGYRGIAPDQRGYGEADPTKVIDATRGAGDFSDDATALLDALAIEQAHIVGCSLGGAVVWRMLIDHPERFLTATLVNPGSPYGFGGTKDEHGTPCTPDFAGTGGGTANPELIQRVREGDRSSQSPFSPRVSMRGLFMDPFIPPREEELLTSVLSIHLGERAFPGDHVPSPNWPYVAPGVWGPANAMSPKYAGDIAPLYDIKPKIDVLWIRGSHDQVVSDTSLSDPGYLGQLGLIPGWPGEDIFPPQPMLRQTRAVLERYAAAGGSYREVVIQNAAHIPFMERPDAFNAALHAHLGAD
jgi:pimeloyl-ACP methyl ester carboxylesterase